MTSTGRKKQRSRQEWFALVREYQQSPLGKYDFCQAHKISRSYFNVWEQSLLAAEAEMRAAPTSSFIPITMADSAQITPASPAIAPAKQIKSSLQLENSNGLRLSFANGCEIWELKAVLEVMDVVK